MHKTYGSSHGCKNNYSLSLYIYIHISISLLFTKYLIISKCFLLNIIIIENPSTFQSVNHVIHLPPSLIIHNASFVIRLISSIRRTPSCWLRASAEYRSSLVSLRLCLHRHSQSIRFSLGIHLRAHSLQNNRFASLVSSESPLHQLRKME